jgi:methyltransferase NSUN6
VSRKAGEAILRGAELYVPGVLAASAGLQRGDRVAVSVAIEQPGR